MTAAGAGQGGEPGGVEPTPRLSAEQEQALAHEAFVARALALRDGAKKESRASGETRVALLTGAFTLMGVLLTGVVTQCAQRSGKSHEMALVEHEAEKRLRRTALDSLNDVIVAMNHASGERLSMARGLYDGMHDTTLDRHAREANSADTRWEKEQESHEFRLQLYYADTATLLPVWRGTRQAVERYAVCASSAMRRFAGGRAPDTTCAARRDSALAGTRALRAALVRSYRAFDSTDRR